MAPYVPIITNMVLDVRIDRSHAVLLAESWDRY